MMQSGYGRDKLWPFAHGGGATLAFFTLLFAGALLLWFAWPHLVSGILLALFSFLWLTVLYFFRDPNRIPVDLPGQIIGPGDGKVVAIEKMMEPRYLKKEVIRLSMFLSLTDVHVQRVPLSGTVTFVDYQPGKFLQAFRPEASEENEFIAMGLATPYGEIVVKQIAGILARRCVNYATVGDELLTGRRYGLIRFGSRIDLYFPTDAKLLVEIGDRVFGGLTPIAQLKPLDKEAR
ncbi:MAG: phosphatidylserine decarboxylase family protein [Anaerolineales bacterium]|nr:phosphatidylserine decarboxylase family protein [Anaerolineales bacterium]MCB0011629.1 phosphatidylserine decarboxylase family protein [Anaerolineales bacterium]MCB8962401.1 phosphatidylserine decarboxylase family protein [Ardenticatenales bacterium]